MARRPHPFPSRTRSLSSSAPMVLRGQTAWESRSPPPHTLKKPPLTEMVRGGFLLGMSELPLTYTNVRSRLGGDKPRPVIGALRFVGEGFMPSRRI
jgi:hypothetical protein